MIRDAVGEILHMSGYSVETAIHGEDALQKLRAGTFLPALILLDLNMPVMSGRELLERLRHEPEALSRIPVVLLSAVPNPEIVGVAGILRKPVGLKAIVEMVRSFLGNPIEAAREDRITRPGR